MEYVLIGAFCGFGSFFDRERVFPAGAATIADSSRGDSSGESILIGDGAEGCWGVRDGSLIMDALDGAERNPAWDWLAEIATARNAWADASGRAASRARRSSAALSFGVGCGAFGAAGAATGLVGCVGGGPSRCACFAENRAEGEQGVGWAGITLTAALLRSRSLAAFSSDQ